MDVVLSLVRRPGGAVAAGVVVLLLAWACWSFASWLGVDVRPVHGASVVASSSDVVPPASSLSDEDLAQLLSRMDAELLAPMSPFDAPGRVPWLRARRAECWAEVYRRRSRR